MNPTEKLKHYFFLAAVKTNTTLNFVMEFLIKLLKFKIKLYLFFKKI